jgi:hypothetical protein
MFVNDATSFCFECSGQRMNGISNVQVRQSLKCFWTVTRDDTLNE